MLEKSTKRLLVVHYGNTMATCIHQYFCWWVFKYCQYNIIWIFWNTHVTVTFYLQLKHRQLADVFEQKLIEKVWVIYFTKILLWQLGNFRIISEVEQIQSLHFGHEKFVLIRLIDKGGSLIASVSSLIFVPPFY